MGDRRLPLLPVPIEEMTRDSLRVFIPKLISEAEGQEKVKMGITTRPGWWPEAVPWTNLRTSEEGGKNKLKLTEVLREVVRRCYQYYDSEHLLQRGHHHHAITAPDSPIKVMNMVDGSVSFIPQKFVNGIPLSQLEAAVPASSEMSATPVPTHVFQRTRVSPPQTGRTRKVPPQVHPVEIFICYFCEKDFTKKSDLHDHQSWCIMRPPELKDLPRKRKLKLVPVDDLPRAERKRFVEGLDLVPLSKARVMKKHKNRSRDIEITKLDDNDTEHSQATLKSPTTPKTPRSLMSQLSRDLSPPSMKNRKKSLMAAFDEEEEEVGAVVKREPAEEVSPAATDQKEESKEKEDRDIIKRTSLLTIDLCSALGQRVKRLMNEQAKVLMTSLLEEEQQPYEEFCHTPKKTGMLARLRNRTADFPVTFRKSRKTLPKYAHQFKFKSGQRQEWYMTSLTGLNARSRELKKLVKKCRVSITRLSKKEIEKWAMRKKTNYSVNISRLSDLHRPGVEGIGGAKSPPRIVLENLLAQPGLKSMPGQPQFSPDQRAALFKGSPVSLTQNLLNKSRAATNVVNLTPPSTPESAKSPRPIQLLAKSPEQARMLQQLLQRPLQNRLPGYVSKANNNNNKNTGQANNNNNTTTAAKKPPQQVSRGKKRILEEDDVICLSSDEESSSESPGSQRRPPPSKYQKTEASRKANPTLLFKCHLCHTELTCYGSFSNYIEKHFSEEHKVNNIQLVEHFDSRGQKVVSIVEKATKATTTNTSTQGKGAAATKKAQATNSGNNNKALSPAKPNQPALSSKQTTNQHNTPGQKAGTRSDSSKSKTSGSSSTSAAAKKNITQAAASSVGRRRSNRASGTSDVICID